MSGSAGRSRRDAGEVHHGGSRIGAGTEVRFEAKGNTLVVRKVDDAPTRGRRLADRLRGRGDVQMSTDEIMALTRSAD